MPIRIRCPHCGSQTNISDELVGATALCGNCLQPIVITSEPIHFEPASIATGSTKQVHDSNTHAGDFLPDLVIRDEPLRQSRRPRIMTCLVMSVLVFAMLACLLPMIDSHPYPPAAARKQHCSNNLRQIALALHNYNDFYGELPPPYVADENGKPMHSWRVLILPFLEHRGLYQKYNFDEPWNGPNNIQLALERPYVDSYTCPSADRTGSAGWTNYMFVVGENAMFENGKATRFAEVTDGLSNTIMVVEVANSSTHWMEPRDLDFAMMGLVINGTSNGDCISSEHSSGAHVALGDGSVRILKNELHPKAVRKLIDRRDGEVVYEIDDW